MKINILALFIAVTLSGGFLAIILIPPSFFNFLPFAIHQAIFKDIFKEKDFIVVFDIIAAILTALILYKVLNRVIPNII